eukprot:gene3307-4161_t
MEAKTVSQLWDLPIEVGQKILEFLLDDLAQVMRLCSVSKALQRWIQKDCLPQLRRLECREAYANTGVEPSLHALVIKHSMKCVQRIVFHNVESEDWYDVHHGQSNERAAQIPLAVLLAPHCSQLRYLDMTKCIDVTESSLRMIGMHCPNLQHLDVSGCEGVTDMSLCTVGTNCSELRLLDVGGTPVTDAAIIRIAQGCPGLECLKLCNTGVTDASIEVVARHCTRLQILDVYDTDVTDVGFERIGQHGPQLLYLNQLLYLQVGTAGDLITDASILSIAKNCPKLRCLGLCDTGVADASIQQVAKLCPELEYLDVAMTGVSDTSIEMIARRCLQLKYLDVAHCDVSDKSIRTVGEKCQQLTYLVVSNTEKVTEKSLQNVAKNCPRLLSIEWEECLGINDVEALARKLRRHCQWFGKLSKSDFIPIFVAENSSFLFYDKEAR